MHLYILFIHSIETSYGGIQCFAVTDIENVCLNLNKSTYIYRVVPEFKVRNNLTLKEIIISNTSMFF